MKTCLHWSSDKIKGTKMKINEVVLQILIRICRFNFGNFEKKEFKKFLNMGGYICLNHWYLLDFTAIKRCHIYSIG